MSSFTLSRRNLRTAVFSIISAIALTACMDAGDEARSGTDDNDLKAHPIESPDGIWTLIDTPIFPADYQAPTEFAVATVNQVRLQMLLDEVPREDQRDPGQPNEPISLPLPDESFAEVGFLRTEILETELSTRFPSIMTFSFNSEGRGHPISGQMAKRESRLHVTASTLQGLLRIDPVMSDIGQVFVIYFDRNRTDGLNEFEHVLDEQTDPTIPPVPRPSLDVLQDLSFKQAMWNQVNASLSAKESTGSELRTFRFLATTTGEFYQNNGNNDGAVLFSLLTRIIGVNAVMEPEISVRLILDADSLNVMFDDPNTDGINDGDTPCNLRDANPGIVSGAGVAEGDYDIGFLFSTGSSGGCAWYVACEDSTGGFPAHDKARGAGHFGADGTGVGTGLILHETGHQLGAKHTYSGQASGCNLANFDGDDATVPSAFAPGSGTTIMSYLASCGTDNVDITTNDNGQYYHAMSFEQILEAINSGDASCAGTINTGNNAPTVDAGPDYTIPRQTPFTLGGSGNDPDGDALTFTWEQIDLATTQRAIDTDDGIGPIIRSVIPDDSPARTVPDIRDLLDNSNQPMNGVQKAGELVPQVDRTLNMRLTARDNRAGGGGVNSDDAVITVSGAPHFVTSPDSGTLSAGCEVPVTWEPGGGNAASVDILASTTGGLAGNGIDESFADVVVLATPNDGQYDMPVPCSSENQYRLKVQASDNIYFDVNDNDLSIVNEPPVAIVDPLVDGEVDGQCEYLVQFSGNVTDSCGIAAMDVEVLLEKKPPGDFTLGNETINIAQNGPTQVDVSGSVLVSDLMSSPATLSVGIKGTDNCGSTQVEFEEVNIVDSTPPVIDVSVSPDSLWPPNHKMIPIQATVIATDNCPGVTFELVSITSDEPADDVGDGKFEPDIENADIGTPDLEFDLRAERAGPRDGRIYTIVYGAQDGSGNTTDDDATVTVDHP